MGRALIGLGYRRFGVVGGPPQLTSTIVRLQGFRIAREEAGITLAAESIVQQADFSRDRGRQATFKLLDKVPDITAIFALNDQTAIGVLAALRERGVAVPEEISVAGFSFPIARNLCPALSTVHLPLVEMGAQAPELALKPRGSEPVVEYLPAEVILRESTAEGRR